MLWRRLAVSLPLAVLVAVLAHGLCFGAQHLPGTVHAGSLLGTLAAGLGLAALLGVWAGALRLERGGALCQSPPDPRRRLLGLCRPAEGPLPSTAILGMGGAAAFCLIELAEGHAPLGAGWLAASALVAATAAVSVIVRLVGRLLVGSGRALASLVAPTRWCQAFFAVTRCTNRIVCGHPLCLSAARGRAPPLPVPVTL